MYLNRIGNALREMRADRWAWHLKTSPHWRIKINPPAPRLQLHDALVREIMK